MKSDSDIKIGPSILSADFARLGEQVREAEVGGGDYVHLDVMDGRFVPNISFGPLVVKAVRQHTRLPLYTHLMIVEPERYIPDFVNAGSDMIQVHQETCPHLHRTLQQIRALGVKASVVINPATPVCQIEEVLEDVDCILVMTVDPGFGGQKFIPNTLRKIRELRQMLDERGLSTDLEVDGGIDAQTVPLVVNAGATALVAGKAVFGTSEGVSKAISRLRKSLEH